MDHPNNSRMLKEVVGLHVWIDNLNDNKADIFAILTFNEGRLSDEKVSFTLHIKQAELHITSQSKSASIISGTASHVSCETTEAQVTTQREKSLGVGGKIKARFMDVIGRGNYRTHEETSLSMPKANAPFKIMFMPHDKHKGKWVIKPNELHQKNYLEGNAIENTERLIQAQYKTGKIVADMLFSVICQKTDFDIKIVEVDGKPLSEYRKKPQNQAAALSLIKKRLLEIKLTHDNTDRAHSDYTIAEYLVDFPEGRDA